MKQVQEMRLHVRIQGWPTTYEYTIISKPFKVTRPMMLRLWMAEKTLNLVPGIRVQLSWTQE